MSHLGLPDALLNRANKELRDKADALHAELRRLEATIRLEQEVLQGTNEKLATAKRQHVTLANAVDSNNRQLSDEESAAALVAQLVDQQRKLLATNQRDAKDWSSKLEAVAAKVDAQRAAVHHAEDKAT